MIRRLSTFLTISVVGMFLVSIAMQADAATWIPTAESTDSANRRVTLNDGMSGFTNNSHAYGYDHLGQEPDENCETLTSTPCYKDGELSMVANLILPICTSAAQNNCIEGLAVGASASSMVPANPEPPSPGYRLEGIPELGIPSGDVPSLFSLPGGDGQNQLYVVNASMLITADRGKVTFQRIQVNVAPVQKKQSPGKRPARWSLITPQADGSFANKPGVVDGPFLDCILVDLDICYEKTEFAPGERAEVGIRLTSEFRGWLKGRLKDPVVTSEKLSSTSVRYVVNAEAVSVPRLDVLIPKTNQVFEEVRAGGYTETNQNGLSNVFRTYRADSKYGIRLVDAAKEYSDDKSGPEVSVWYFATIDNQDANSPCLSREGQFSGLVTTNAMAFDGGIPKWDGFQLSYTVAGMHYKADGATEVEGVYDLIMLGDVARCLYGFSKAPLSATVQVSGGGEAQKIATTILSENNGWLKLAAYGFTFSEKEIQVKLTQPYSKTLTKFTGTTKSLSAKQKTEIKTTVTKAKSNPKFICTGTYVSATNKATALARAKAACNYAKSLDKNHSYFAQAKQTSAKSYDGKVMLVSK